MQPSFQITPRYLLVISLFLIASLHTMIFAFFQIPNNFLSEGFHAHIFYLKLLAYAVAIVTSCMHQMIVRKVSLKHTFIAGLFCNMLALITIWISLTLGGILPLVFLSMIWIGLALPSVLNCLITYIILEFPQKIGVGMLLLFAFANLGVMASSFFFTIFHARHFSSGFFITVLILLAISIWFVTVKFFDPPFPKHLEHLRKGTHLWRELHYRLGLFVIAIVAYGITESTFGIWGEIYMRQFLFDLVASQAIAAFWLSLIVGQLFLVAPMYFFPARRILPLLILLVFFALHLFPYQSSFTGILIALILGGLGCSAVFPVLLSFLEREIILVAKEEHAHSYLPFIETGTSFMIGGYFLGVGILDLWVDSAQYESPLPLETPFLWAMALIASVGLITIYLNWTAES